jgi:hypothetical protein
MNTTNASNAIEHSTDTELSAQHTDPETAETAETVATVALDEVNGGWLYGPYAGPYGAPYASPWGAAHFEARLARRAEWMDRRAAARWWGF